MRHSSIFTFFSSRSFFSQSFILSLYEFAVLTSFTFKNFSFVVILYSSIWAVNLFVRKHRDYFRSFNNSIHCNSNSTTFRVARNKLYSQVVFLTLRNHCCIEFQICFIRILISYLHIYTLCDIQAYLHLFHQDRFSVSLSFFRSMNLQFWHLLHSRILLL